MKKRKILMVDDEKDFTSLMKLFLEDAGGYEVRVENDGGVALEAAREFKPELILLDVVMPDIDGGEVANQIKSDNSLKGVPIVFLTAIIEKGQAVQGGLIGGHVFLPKPVTGEQLLACIRENIIE